MQSAPAMQTTLIRRPVVQDKTGLPKSTMYLLIQAGKFPAPVKIGQRAVAWVSADVDKWISDRIRGVM